MWSCFWFMSELVCCIRWNASCNWMASQDLRRRCQSVHDRATLRKTFIARTQVCTVCNVIFMFIIHRLVRRITIVFHYWYCITYRPGTCTYNMCIVQHGFGWSLQCRLTLMPSSSTVNASCPVLPRVKLCTVLVQKITKLHKQCTA